MVYHGHGWIALIVFLGAFAAASHARVELRSQWLGCLVVVFASVVLMRLGYGLNHRRPIAKDDSGNIITHKPYHALMWIPVEYWSLITLAFGLLTVFKK